MELFLPILLWLGIWYISGILLTLSSMIFHVKFGYEDHYTLEDIIQLLGWSLLGLFIMPILLYYIIQEINKKKGKIIVWRSKSYIAKQVLGLDK